jgi:hypothetical protein
MSGKMLYFGQGPYVLDIDTEFSIPRNGKKRQVLRVGDIETYGGSFVLDQRRFTPKPIRKQ